MSEDEPQTMIYYITNNIDRLLRMPCDENRFRTRSRDVAETLRIAAREGERAACHHLIDILGQAEQGRYRHGG